MATVLIIEPFFGGSHKQLIDTLIEGLNTEDRFCVVTLPAKKWHWRARTSALRISQLIPTNHTFQKLFASSVLNLAELIALRPDLQSVHKLVYFHENQLVYPVRKSQDRDFQYGYNQITSCLVADQVIFNSLFNKKSFLDNISKFLKLQPDCRPVGITEQIAPKCSVLYFPMNFPPCISGNSQQGPLHIVWPHRWEHDKDPDTFISVLLSLEQSGKDFKVSLLGKCTSDVPASIENARKQLESKVRVWGHIDSREDYLAELRQGDVVVSTALHEFYGVAMLEGVACGCYPLCPNNLVYPEIYPPQCLYTDSRHLLRILTDFCDNPDKPRMLTRELQFDLHKFSTRHLLPQYKDLLLPT